MECGLCVRRAGGEPRGWKWGGIRAARSSSRPARAAEEKRVRSITRNSYAAVQSVA